MAFFADDSKSIRTIHRVKDKPVCPCSISNVLQHAIVRALTFVLQEGTQAGHGSTIDEGMDHVDLHEDHWCHLECAITMPVVVVTEPGETVPSPKNNVGWGSPMP